MKICGIDEAGRGCIAGSLFVAGVLSEVEITTNDKDLFSNFNIKYIKQNSLHNLVFSNEIKDSKVLSENKIKDIYEKLLKSLDEREFFIVKCDSKMIDSFGLSFCLKDAIIKIQNFINQYNKNVRFIVDGNTNFGLNNLDYIIKGDSLLKNISAASILAKYSKNLESIELDSIFPQYHLAQNKGYGSKAHLESIKTYGLLPIHRKSFNISID